MSDAAAFRLLHLVQSLDRKHGGPVAGIVAVARHRLALGMRLEAVSLDPPSAECVRQFPIPAIGLGWSGLCGRFGYSPLLVPWLRENAGRFDCVLVHGIWGYHAIAAHRALAGTKTPYVVYTHGMMDPWFKRQFPLKHLKKQAFWTLFLGRVFRDARCVLFTAEEERRQSLGVYAGYAGFRQRVVKYGTDDVVGDAGRQIEIFRQAVPALDGRPYLLFLGRIHVKKGCDLLIEAFAGVARRHPDIDLVIAGPDESGWRTALAASARRLGVEARLHWPGMLSGEAKWGALRGAQAFVLPSHQENFGIAVAEALACGTPVLISNKVNIWREIEAAGGGLVGEDSAEGMTRLLDAFLAMPSDERQALGRAARQCFVDNFDASRFAGEIVEVVRGNA
jgi:glycosyltransferase involved in cell wall biosynthesis